MLGSLPNPLPLYKPTDTSCENICKGCAKPHLRLHKLVYSLQFCFGPCVRIIQSQAWSDGAFSPAELPCTRRGERSLHTPSVRSEIASHLVTFMKARQTFPPHEARRGIFFRFLSRHAQMVQVPQIDPFVPRMCHSTLFLFSGNHLAFRMQRWIAFAYWLFLVVTSACLAGPAQSFSKNMRSSFHQKKTGTLGKDK